MKKSQTLNFLWLNLDLPAPADPKGGGIRKPLPEEYIENVRKAGKAHPDAEIDFWVDSKRLTERQMAYLQHVFEDGVLNVHLKDLRGIPEYCSEELYNQSETNKNWRDNYYAKIWLQVDAAKILISLQSDADQTFFADLDHAHLDIESDAVQKMLGKHGLLIGSCGANYVSLENQLWGFEKSRRKFFEEYYEVALKAAKEDGSNGFGPLCSKVSQDLQMKEKIPLDEICLPIGSKGMAHAVQPGADLSGEDSYFIDFGYTEKKQKKKKLDFFGLLKGEANNNDDNDDPSRISSEKLAAAFNQCTNPAHEHDIPGVAAKAPKAPRQTQKLAAGMR